MLHLYVFVLQCKVDCYTRIWDYLPNGSTTNSVLILKRLVTVTCKAYFMIMK